MNTTQDTHVETRIREAARALQGEAVEMVRTLVQKQALLGQEQAAQEHVAQVFEGLGLKVEEFEIDEHKLKQHPAYAKSLISFEGRTNVVGVHRPTEPEIGRSLILNGHVDVVPVGPEILWTKPPFGAVVEGDRIYGRGTADMQAGIVAFTMAYKALASLGLAPASTLYLQSVIEEECTGNGALACIVEGYRADAAICTEPVPAIATCHMGVFWITVDILGMPVHASRATTGVGAIEFGMYLFHELKKTEAKWNAPENRHARFRHHAHPINFNLGRIQGGEWTSSISSACRIDLRIGFYPDTKIERAKAEIEAALAAAHAAHPNAASVSYTVSYEGLHGEGSYVDDNAPVVLALKECHNDVLGKMPETVALTGAFDGKHFNLYGDTPAVAYGPTGGNIHGVDEWVSIDSMMDVVEVLALFIARWCGLRRTDDGTVVMPAQNVQP
jgi:acetylornithine deacetylase